MTRVAVMDNQTTISDDGVEELSLFGEVRSILISGIGIVFNTAVFLQDEIDLATWRRVILTVVISMVVVFLITNTGFAVFELLIGIDLSLVMNDLVDTSFRVFVIDLGVQFVRVFVAGYWSFRSLKSQETATDFVTHMQCLVIGTIPFSFLISASSLLNLVFVTLYANRFQFAISESNLNIIVITWDVILIVSVIFLYWLVARILYLVYPQLSRATRLSALVRIIVANVLIGVVVNLQTLVNIFVSLLPPGTFDLMVP